VQRVTDIMGEIAAASEEQSSGIDQVARAVTQMDEVTQQNAALVEEAAAAASSLEDQAGKLRTAVAVFQLEESGFKAPVSAAPKRVTAPVRPMAARKVSHSVSQATPVARTPAAPAATPAPAAAAPTKTPARAAASAGSDQDWETF
jgi:methyl-accepting chemotaxis protein-1 (serine sensor receptor)